MGGVAVTCAEVQKNRCLRPFLCVNLHVGPRSLHSAMTSVSTSRPINSVTPVFKNAFVRDSTSNNSPAEPGELLCLLGTHHNSVAKSLPTRILRLANGSFSHPFYPALEGASRCAFQGRGQKPRRYLRISPPLFRSGQPLRMLSTLSCSFGQPHASIWPPASADFPATVLTFPPACSTIGIRAAIS